MPRTHNEILLQRFRHMIVGAMVKPATVTDAELLDMAKGKTLDDKLASIEAVLSVVAPGYFERRGL